MKHTITLIAGLLLAPLQNISAVETAAKPYNVLFIAIDDLNDWSGAFGGAPQALSVTPRMDKFAQTGSVVFQQANCAGPVCCPSRSALLSGSCRTGQAFTATNITCSSPSWCRRIIPSLSISPNTATGPCPPRPEVATGNFIPRVV